MANGFFARHSSRSTRWHRISADWPVSGALSAGAVEFGTKFMKLAGSKVLDPAKLLADIRYLENIDNMRTLLV
ncbi:hypothetical protein [Bosea sp. 2RAB26]|uniref:hypothetical protein n=1 Tax=Bosea sp. 2RAB26 TaxID=3237476 RepID=UPI003F93CD56